MNIDACLQIVNKLISDMDTIISNGAKTNDTKSLDKFRDIYIQKTQLLRTLFPDADKRIKDEDENTIAAAKRDDKRDGRELFIEQAKVMRRYLISMRNSIELRLSSEKKEDKLDNLRKKVVEKEVESERRKKVTETKFYGAAIEIIDRLRDQLKNDGDIKQEIINIKNELSEIKETLVTISKKSDSKESPE